jgi:hypothetical protein
MSGKNIEEKLNSHLIALFRVGLASLVLNLYLNWIFYPDLLSYQSSRVAAFYINKNYPGVPAGCLSIYSPSFEFYLNDTLIKTDTATLKQGSQPKPAIWYITEKELDFIKQQNLRYEMIKEFDEFHVTMLTLKFINTKTRSRELKKYYLVNIL